MTSDEDDNRARSRWIVLQLVRLSGIAFLILGMAIGLNRTSLPPELGYILMAAGFFEIFGLTAILAKRWKSPPS